MKRFLFVLAAISSGLAAELPDYQPRMAVTGVLRSRGNDQMVDLLQRWEAGFRKFHPEVQFADALKSTASAAYGLGTVRARVFLYFPQALAARMLERVDTP